MLGYFKNFPLLAAFIGLGVGCLLAGHPRKFWVPSLWLLGIVALAVAVRLAVGEAVAVDVTSVPVAVRDGVAVDAHQPVFEWEVLGVNSKAQLAELERIVGPGRVPAWFVLTDTAFREVLTTPLAAAIEHVLRRNDLLLADKAAEIRGLWERAPLPDALVAEIHEAYTRLEEAAGDANEPPEAEPLVAVAVGVLVWDEPLRPLAWVGGAFVLAAGIHVARKAR